MVINRNKIIEDLKEANEHQNVSENDMNVYELLYTNLEKKDTDDFPLEFSENIIQQIEAKQQRRFNIKMYCLVSFLLLVSIPFFIGFLNKDIISVLFSAFEEHMFIIVFIVTAIVIMQRLEKMLIPKSD